MNNISDLILVRGVSGAGKSSVADCIAAGRDQWHKVPVFSTDDYFMVTKTVDLGNKPNCDCQERYSDDDYGDPARDYRCCGIQTVTTYEFDGEKLPQYHKLCQVDVEEAMKDWNINTIVVANTFTTEWEMEPYFKLAKKHDYNVHTIIVENRHESKSIHNVPSKVITMQKERFNIKL